MLRIRPNQGLVASFVLLAASVALAPSGTAQTVQKFTANIAYDQVGRLLWHATPPPPTSFAEDAARIAALPSDKDVPNANAIYSTAEAMQAMGSNPLTGMAVPAMAMAYNAQIAAYNAKMTAMSAAFQKAGAMSHDSFYRGWSRFDNPRLQSATILKPDQGLEIALDLAKRTYREKRAAPRTGLSVETYVVSSAEELTITFGSEPVVKALGPLTLAGLPARGYQTDATFMLSGNYGLCSSGTHVLREIEYVADVPDPIATPGSKPDANQLARLVCASPASSHNEPGKLVLFRSTSLTDGGSAGDFVNVLERGNLRELGSADAPLFSIPPNFSEVH